MVNSEQIKRTGNEASGTVSRRFEDGYALPPLSVIALKLLELASDENASNDQIVKLIESDPSLAVRLLNLANSALLGGGRPAASLSHAVMRLGSNQIKLMALSISLRGSFPMGTVDQFDFEQFWRVSVYRGLIAKSLAQRSKAANPEEAFLGGLTLEIGLPIFFDFFVKGKSDPISLSLEPLEELLLREKTAFGLDHRQVGATALKFWKFPAHIVACQGLYGEGAGGADVPVLCRICELARLFSRVLLKAPGSFRSFYTEAEKLLGLDQEVLHDIVVSTFSEVESIAQALKLEINKEKDLMEIMEKANRALVQISRKVSTCSGDNWEPSLPTFDSINQNQKTVANTLQAVAHEIRNPLTIVGGFARRLASAADPGTDVGKYARVILEESLRLERILSAMPAELQKG
jgi:HD-like signal output (HDOD) protein